MHNRMIMTSPYESQDGKYLQVKYTHKLLTVTSQKQTPNLKVPSCTLCCSNYISHRTQFLQEGYHKAYVYAHNYS